MTKIHRWPHFSAGPAVAALIFGLICLARSARTSIIHKGIVDALCAIAWAGAIQAWPHHALTDSVIAYMPRAVITCAAEMDHQDNVTVEVDAVVYYNGVIQVKINLNAGVQHACTLCANPISQSIGDLTLDELFNLHAHDSTPTDGWVLDEATNGWG